MATSVIATSRIPDYVPLSYLPNSFHIPPQTPVAPARLSDVDASLKRIDFELGEVGRVLSRFAPLVHNRENVAVFLEPEWVADGLNEAIGRSTRASMILPTAVSPAWEQTARFADDE